MRCTKKKTIFDPYTILPSYGENSVVLTYQDNILNLGIFYDSAINDVEEKLIISFEHICFHKFTSFPGIEDSKIEFEKYNDLTCLVEFEESDFKTSWERHFNNLFKFRHFRIFFIGTNYYFEVVCEEMSVVL